MTGTKTTMIITVDDYKALWNAYAEVAEIVWNSDDLKPCWTQVAELDEILEDLDKRVKYLNEGIADL